MENHGPFKENLSQRSIIIAYLLKKANSSKENLSGKNNSKTSWIIHNFNANLHILGPEEKKHELAPEELNHIRRVLKTNPEFAKRIPSFISALAEDEFSPREREMISLCESGVGPVEIGRRFGADYHTVASTYSKYNQMRRSNLESTLGPVSRHSIPLGINEMAKEHASLSTSKKNMHRRNKN